MSRERALSERKGTVIECTGSEDRTSAGHIRSGHEETECWRAGGGRCEPECRMEIEGDEGFQGQRMLTLMWRKLFLSEAKKMVSVCMKP